MVQWYALCTAGSLAGVQTQDRFFLHFFVTCLAEKIGFPCTNKACQKKRNSHRLPMCIFLSARWVCPLTSIRVLVPQKRLITGGQ